MLCLGRRKVRRKARPRVERRCRAAEVRARGGNGVGVAKRVTTSLCRRRSWIYLCFVCAQPLVGQGIEMEVRK
ncbi:unnamed protein product [Linum trigynum]|uniref:Uncharacterized protein n=1 Tax=Linum trigynum TaxID=586398 RepID=A0AAV2G984_9ROSI